MRHHPTLTEIYSCTSANLRNGSIIALPPHFHAQPPSNRDDFVRTLLIDGEILEICRFLEANPSDLTIVLFGFDNDKRRQNMQQRPFVTNNVLPSGIADQYELLVFQTAR